MSDGTRARSASEPEANVDDGSRAGSTSPEPERAPASSAPIVSPASPVAPTDTWIVRGRVHDGDVPISGARVSLSLAPGSTRERIGEAITDANGAFEHDATHAIGALTPIQRDLTRLVASARAAGYCAGTLDVELERRDSDAIELDLDLDTGGMVSGRVRDRSGAPVQDAHVELRDVGQWIGSSETDEHGEFEIAFWMAGRHSLHAAKFDLGGAVMSGLELDPARDRDAGEMVLRNGGAITGRAIYPSGDPVADLVVVAVPPGEEHQSRPAFASPDGDGLLRGRTRTGSDGSFRIAGLAPGHFEVFAPNVTDESGGRQLREPGDEGIELVVERHRLLVRVEDDAGRPLRFASLLLRHGDVVQTATVEREDGVHEILGDPGVEWTISASAPSCLPAEARHRFDEQSSDDRMTLVLRRIGPERGSLRLELTAEGSTLLDGATVDVRTQLGSVVENGYRIEVGADLVVRDLVPGRFRVTVRPGRSVVRGFPEFTWFFPLEMEADVVADEERVVRANVRAGGRLRFTASVPAGANLSGLAGAKLLLIDDGIEDASLRVVVQVFEDGANYGGLPLAPDTKYASARLLEPGVHTLRLAANGFHDLERTFTIRPGEFTDVELALAVK